MNWSWLAPSLAAVSFAVLLSGCLSQGDVVVPRAFDPLTEDMGEPIDVRVERVTAARHLDERWLWRLSKHEVAFDDLHHWVEAPRDLVESALHRVESASSAQRRIDVRRIDVHIEAFDLDRMTGAVRIQARVRIAGGDSNDLVVEAPWSDGSVEAVAAAAADAVQQFVGSIRQLARRDG